MRRLSQIKMKEDVGSNKFQPISELDPSTYVNLIGYNDIEERDLIYNFALHGLENVNSILDLGCGMCDIIDFLPGRVSDEFTYTGIEANSVLVNHHKTKMNVELLNSGSIILGNYLTMELPIVDWVLNIQNLLMSYWDSYDKWERLYVTISQSLQAANVGVIITLLHSNNGVDSFCEYPIPNLTDALLERFNVKFVIDYSVMDNIYKLILLK